MSVNITGIAELSRRLAEIQRQDGPEMNRLALNDMAFAVLEGNKVLMKGVFDRPTPFTLNAFFVRKATRENLSATVERKDMVRGKHYLEVQDEGGSRPATGIERLMKSRLKYSGIIAAVLPTKHLRTNKYGNIATGRINQILSGVKAQGDSTANASDASRRRAGSRRADYFVPRDGSKLTPGVYERKNKGIKKVLAFSEAAPNYSKRFPMEEHAEGVAAGAAEAAFERAFRRVMSGG